MIKNNKIIITTESIISYRRCYGLLLFAASWTAGAHYHAHINKKRYIWSYWPFVKRLTVDSTVSHREIALQIKQNKKRYVTHAKKLTKELANLVAQCAADLAVLWTRSRLEMRSVWSAVTSPVTGLRERSSTVMVEASTCVASTRSSVARCCGSWNAAPAGGGDGDRPRPYTLSLLRPLPRCSWYHGGVPDLNTLSVQRWKINLG